MKPTPETLSPLFDRAAEGYDLLNSLMSLGQDAAWRRAMVSEIQPGDRVLDLCCGSARSSVAAAKRSGGLVVGADVSWGMLVRGAAHAATAGVRFAAVRADAFHLPFQDGAFDVITVAWGLRNLVPEPAALAEMRRVLGAGGRLLVLDSPSPEPGPIGAFHRGYVRWIVPALGRLSADPAAYRYLSESILRFGRAHEVARRIEAAGFVCQPPRSLTLGAAALWRAQKTAQSATNGVALGQSARAAPVPRQPSWRER
ncbi:MAG TPA: ubiquinone/menaquinone biosynthesis methyltransferase [Candidatus Eisenbacteria bacterium]|nr:ubiquinone/menaquinone biosynthesis methyltransferase [Candidatus Eisenbacteria bacterium]